MDINTISTLISGVGFPICAYLLSLKMIDKKDDMIKDMLNKQNDLINAINDNSNSISNNTKVLTELVVEVKELKEVK